MTEAKLKELASLFEAPKSTLTWRHDVGVALSEFGIGERTTVQDLRVLRTRLAEILPPGMCPSIQWLSTMFNVPKFYSLDQLERLEGVSWTNLKSAMQIAGSEERMALLLRSKAEAWNATRFRQEADEQRRRSRCKGNRRLSYAKATLTRMTRRAQVCQDDLLKHAVVVQGMREQIASHEDTQLDRELKSTLSATIDLQCSLKAIAEELGERPLSAPTELLKKFQGSREDAMVSCQSA